MRTLTETIKEVLNSEFMEVKDLVEIIIPEYTYVDGDVTTVLPEVPINIAASPATIDGKLYDNTLREVGSIKFALGSSPDTASINVENVSRGFGKLLISDRKLDGTRCTIKRAFKTVRGWETDVLFKDGFVRDIRIGTESITLSVISEMSRKQAQIAERSATQRCIFTFQGDDCGHDPSVQPGNPNFCDKTEDGDDGCKAHANLPRFGAIPAFGLINGSGYDDFPNNFPDPRFPTSCVVPDTLILVQSDGKKSYRKAKNLRVGDLIVAVDLFGKPFPANINKVHRGTSDKLLRIKTDSYSVICSPTHRIIKGLGDSNGIPAENLEVGDKVLVYSKSDRVAKLESVVSLVEISEESDVITFSLDQYYTYVGGQQRSGGIVYHNRKYGTGRYPGEQMPELPPAN